MAVGILTAHQNTRGRASKSACLQHERLERYQVQASSAGWDRRRDWYIDHHDNAEGVRGGHVFVPLARGKQREDAVGWDQAQVRAGRSPHSKSRSSARLTSPHSDLALVYNCGITLYYIKPFFAIVR